MLHVEVAQMSYFRRIHLMVGLKLRWHAAGAAPEVPEISLSPEAAVRPGIVSLLV